MKLYSILFFQSREEDENGDGRPDLLRFNLEMPLLDTENVVGVRLVLFFYYKLLVGVIFTQFLCLFTMPGLFQVSTVSIGACFPVFVETLPQYSVFSSCFLLPFYLNIVC